MKQILLIGPAPWATGGIASVNRDILRSPVINEKYDITMVETWNHKNWLKAFVFSLFKVHRHSKSADLVHIALSAGGGCYRKMLLQKLIHRKPYILHLHSGRFISFYRSQPAFFRRWIARFLNEAKRIICVSHTVAESVQKEFSISADNILCIYNGVHLSEKNAPKQTASPFNVLFMGSLIANRCIDEYLTLADSFQNDTGIRFWVAGDGTRNDWDMHNVTYAGTVQGAEKQSLLQQTDLLIDAFYYESFGLALVECMNAGIAIIGRRACAIPEILSDGEYGILFDNYSEIRDSICLLREDAAMLETYQRKAFERSLNFSMSSFEKSLSLVYDSLLYPSASQK